MGFFDKFKIGKKESFENRVLQLFEKHNFTEIKSALDASKEITHGKYIITRKGENYFDKDKRYLITLVESPSGVALEFADHAFDEYSLINEIEKINANLVICRYKNREITRAIMDKFKEVQIVNFRELEDYLSNL